MSSSVSIFWEKKIVLTGKIPSLEGFILEIYAAQSSVVGVNTWLLA